MTNHGMLIVFTEPTAAMEEELHDWYEMEHVPERLAIPGFLSAARFISLDRSRHFLALYDLEQVDVLNTEAYRAFAGENFSPWTKRVVSRVKFTRLEAVQILPGQHRTAPSARLMLMRFDDLNEGDAQRLKDVVAALNSAWDLHQLRVFEVQQLERPTHLVLAPGHLDMTPSAKLLAEPALAAGLSSAELFAPFRNG